MVNDGVRSFNSFCALPCQKLSQIGLVCGQEIPEEMHLSPASSHAELASCDYSDLSGWSGGQRRSDTGKRIVIGQSNCNEACLGCVLCDRGRGRFSVGRGGVNVEIDKPH
jgi:hypothetical protein